MVDSKVKQKVEQLVRILAQLRWLACCTRRITAAGINRPLDQEYPGCLHASLCMHEQAGMTIQI